jgi:hypothetical protein
MPAAAAAETREWNPSPRVRAFLAAYRATASITRAAAAARIDRHVHYKYLASEPLYKAAFAKATAIAADALEDEAVRRAHVGVERIKLYHGKPVLIPANPKKPRGKQMVLVEREYSDTLLQTLLRAKKPEQYKDRVEHGVTPDAGKRFVGTLVELLGLHRELTKGDDAA